jgi:hypothetical protein
MQLVLGFRVVGFEPGPCEGMKAENRDRPTEYCDSRYNHRKALWPDYGPGRLLDKTVKETLCLQGVHKNSVEFNQRPIPAYLDPKAILALGARQCRELERYSGLVRRLFCRTQSQVSQARSILNAEYFLGEPS